MDSFDIGHRIQQVSIQFVPFMMAVVFHECAHGFVAYKWGDHTAKEKGRLTLNPLPHLDMLGTVIFPLVGMFSGMNLLFGWAKPVPIDPRRFRKYRHGLFWVSLAGPGMNFFLAFLSAAMFCVIDRWVPESFYLFKPLEGMTIVSISLNYALGIFNLIPLPPLDGSKIVESFLSIEATRKYEMFSQYSFFILLGLLWAGAFSVLVVPIQYASEMTLMLMANLFHLSGAVQ